MALLYSLQPRKNTFLSFFMFHIQLQLLRKHQLWFITFISTQFDFFSYVLFLEAWRHVCVWHGWKWALFSSSRVIIISIHSLTFICFKKMWIKKSICTLFIMSSVISNLEYFLIYITHYRKKLKKSQCTPLFMNAFTMRGNHIQSIITVHYYYLVISEWHIRKFCSQWRQIWSPVCRICQQIFSNNWLMQCMPFWIVL